MSKKLMIKIFSAFLALLISQSVSAKPMYDYDGDGKADPAIVRTENGQYMWYVLESRNGYSVFQWGQNISSSQDDGVAADYDGDGKTDVAVYRHHVFEEGESYFYILYSSTNTYAAIQWGSRYDSAMPQDYDGDGKADVAVFRPSDGIWYILQSCDGFRAEQFGGRGGSDNPIPGDYDGDGKADLAVYRQDRQIYRGDYTFYIRRSSDGGLTAEKLGYAQADMVAPGNYDGDGKTDIAVWRGRSEYGNGVWYWHRSSDGAYDQMSWGVPGTDLPEQDDYDGDGKTDIAVYRRTPLYPSQSLQAYFFINGSKDGFTAIPWGIVNRDAAARRLY